MKLLNWVLLGLVSVSPLALAGESPEEAAAKAARRAIEKWAATDAEKGGLSYKLQGEYVGSIGPDKCGVQVVARKESRFLAVVFAGGLPGDGATGRPRGQLWGKRDGDKAVFAGPDGQFTFTVDGEKLAGKTTNGDPFELSKVHRQSPTLGLKPPAGATVLFDGTGADAWRNARLAGNLLMMGPTTKREFGSFTAHIEFQIPFMPNAEGQARGNSGFYVQGRYEVQLLDSFGLEPRDNECGGIYSRATPKLIASFPPLAWQTYDIDFTAARFDAAGNKTADAVITVKHNGIVIHDAVKLAGPTPGGPKSGGTENSPGPIFLQDHDGDPVLFRNIWIVEK